MQYKAELLLKKTGKRTTNKAISPIIATIILIAITVAFGLVVYGIATGVAGSASSNTQLSVIQATLVQPSSGSASFSMTLKNSGSTPLNHLNVNVQGLTGLTNSSLTMMPQTTLSPGESISVMGTSTASCTVGNTYVIQISATAGNGGSYSTSTSVACTTS
jgi:flagellin-like protein